MGVDEPIFLELDKKVILEDIDWFIMQAGKRCYSVPAAFMSSKPKVGINHKAYGVTSEAIAERAAVQAGISKTREDRTSRFLL